MELTKETINTLKEGLVPLQMFDPTIRDAMYITRALGIPYIWIDALCIVQDFIGKDSEWNKEASRMNEIYGGATLTLVAADARSVMDGFLTDRQYPQHIAMSYIDTGGEAVDTNFSARVSPANGTRPKTSSKDPGAAVDGRCRKVYSPAGCFITHPRR